MILCRSNSFPSLETRNSTSRNDYRIIRPRERIYLTLLTIFIIRFNHQHSITKCKRKACNLSTQKIADSQRTLSLRLPLRKCFQTIARLLLEIVRNETLQLWFTFQPRCLESRSGRIIIDTRIRDRAQIIPQRSSPVGRKRGRGKRREKKFSSWYTCNSTRNSPGARKRS